MSNPPMLLDGPVCPLPGSKRFRNCGDRARYEPDRTRLWRCRWLGCPTAGLLRMGPPSCLVLMFSEGGPRNRRRPSARQTEYGPAELAPGGDEEDA